MLSVLVQINLSKGLVVISGSEDGGPCELRLQWKGNQDGQEGFQIVDNTFNSLLLTRGMFISVSDTAAEIFLKEIINGIQRIMDSGSVQYSTEYGTRLSAPVFLPPSIHDEDDIEDFVSDQAALTNIWGMYRRNGELDIQHLDLAHKEEVLYDFVSLLNFERFILITQLERN